MKVLPLLLAPLVLSVSCQDQSQVLEVRPFLLRDERRDPGEEPLVRMEKQRILRGAVSMEERSRRLGQYYTILWNLPQKDPAEATEIRFEYRQGSTASQVRTRSQQFPASATSGKAVFSIIGDDYTRKGRVLAWRISLIQGGETVNSKQSYLWD